MVTTTMSFTGTLWSKASSPRSAGFHCFWMTEHHFYEEIGHSSAPEITLTAIGDGGTTRIRLGHAVVVMACNNPIRVAERAATLDIFSNGRARARHREKALPPITPKAFGIDMERSRESWPEAMECVCSLFKHENYPGFEGKFYRFPPRALVPRPMQKPHPALVDFGGKPRILRDGGTPVASASWGSSPPRPRLSPRWWRTTGGRRPEADPSQFFGAFANFKIAATANAYCDTDDRRGKAIGGAAARVVFRWENEAPLSQIRLKEYFDKEKFAKALEIYRQTRLSKTASWSQATPIPVRGPSSDGRSSALRSSSFCPQAGRTTHEQAKRSIELFGEKVLPRFRE